MERADLEELRGKVSCAAALEERGFALDHKESTRRARKYRRNGEIIIVIHDGLGWFDPLSDAKGDVFRLVQHLAGVPFVDALDQVASLVGFEPTEPALDREIVARRPLRSVTERWQARRKPWRGSATWRYLRDTRRLPEHIIRTAISAGALREGPHGSMWAVHIDAGAAVCGWEERGPDWRGFATGGTKVLFRLGPPNALRICVTEAAIDAMSLAAIEELRPDTIYLSTGGGWSPLTAAEMRSLAAQRNAQLVAATDRNRQGDDYAARLKMIAGESGCEFQRLKPDTEDWNQDLCAAAVARPVQRTMGEAGREEAHCHPTAGRVKGEASPG